jgi:hypothetical protein
MGDAPSGAPKRGAGYFQSERSLLAFVFIQIDATPQPALQFSHQIRARWFMLQ